MRRCGWDDGKGVGVSPGGDERLMVESWTEDGEFERFVVFTTYDKVLGELVLEVLHKAPGEFAFGLQSL